MEYEIHNDRPGLLGDIATFLGLMGVNISMINGIAKHKRGMLVNCSDYARIVTIKNALARAENIELTAFRKPNFIDRINLKHGKIIGFCEQTNSYSFIREELGILVDFLGEVLSRQRPRVGFRGMPRVGKTEASIASCVHANKKWVIVSATLTRQIMRRQLMDDEKGSDVIYIVDGIVSGVRGSQPHKELVREVMDFPAPIIIEHPDIFLREFDLGPGFFDYMLELRRSDDEVIDYQLVSQSFSSFDIS